MPVFHHSTDERTDQAVMSPTLPPLVMVCPKMNHIGIEVSSAKASLRFYTQVLGFEEVPRPNFDGPGHWIAGGGFMLHISEVLCEERREELKQRREFSFEGLDKNKVGLHFAFVVEDLSRIRELIREHHIRCINIDCTESSGSQQVFIQDPDGYMIELSTPVAPKFQPRILGM